MPNMFIHKHISKQQTPADPRRYIYLCGHKVCLFSDYSLVLYLTEAGVKDRVLTTDTGESCPVQVGDGTEHHSSPVQVKKVCPALLQPLSVSSPEPWRTSSETLINVPDTTAHRGDSEC